MRRENPDRPLIGVGALIVKDEQVVMVKRSHEPGKGLWSIPGGLIQLGETLREAVIREVKEETGLDVNVKEMCDTCDLIINEGERIKYHYVLISFRANVIGGVMKASSDVEDVQWIPMKDINNLNITKTAKRLIKTSNHTRFKI